MQRRQLSERQSSAQEGFFLLRLFPKCWGNLQEACSGCSLSCILVLVQGCLSLSRHLSLEMFTGLISVDNKTKNSFTGIRYSHIFHRITGPLRSENTSAITKSNLCPNTTVPTTPHLQEHFQNVLLHSFRTHFWSEYFRI